MRANSQNIQMCFASAMFATAWEQLEMGIVVAQVQAALGGLQRQQDSQHIWDYGYTDHMTAITGAPTCAIKLMNMLIMFKSQIHKYQVKSKSCE